MTGIQNNHTLTQHAKVALVFISSNQTNNYPNERGLADLCPLKDPCPNLKPEAEMVATRQLSRHLSNLPYRIRRPLRIIQDRKLTAHELSSPGGLGDGEALESDVPKLCGTWPASAAQADWPRLAGARV